MKRRVNYARCSDRLTVDRSNEQVLGPTRDSPDRLQTQKEDEQDTDRESAQNRPQHSILQTARGGKLQGSLSVLTPKDDDPSFEESNETKTGISMCLGHDCAAHGSITWDWEDKSEDEKKPPGGGMPGAFPGYVEKDTRSLSR